MDDAWSGVRPVSVTPSFCPYQDREPLRGRQGRFGEGYRPDHVSDTGETDDTRTGSEVDGPGKSRTFLWTCLPLEGDPSVPAGK